MQSGRAALSFSATHTETINDDALLSLISLFNQSRGSPGQQHFHFQANLITRESDSDKTVQESSAPASCSDIISSSSWCSFCESISFFPHLINDTFCLFLLISSSLHLTDVTWSCWLNAAKSPLTLFPWQISCLCHTCVMDHLSCHEKGSHISIYIYHFLSQCVSCVFVLQAICVRVSDSVCVCWCVRPSVPYRVWSSLPKLCLPL